MNEPSAEFTPQILVVDDTPENLQIVGATLSRHIPCDLSFATDGRQALESIKESPPVLILLDVMMPGMSGFEVCKRLKENPQTAKIPVLFLTAKVESADVVAGFEAGAIDYIVKPFNPSELIARVKTQLKIHRTESERLKLETQNRMLQKSESLSRMAGAIAHHFNNQLHAVMGYLELIGYALHEGKPADKLLANALQSSHDASKLSNLMLTYLGHLQGRRHPVDLSDLCRRTLSGLPDMPPGTAQLQTDLPASGPLIQADDQMIELMLTHLLTNARESIGDNPGRIQLRLKTASASDISSTHRFPADWVPQDSTYATLEVIDTGCGIPPEEIEKIFDPFFTSKFTGRGMGLPVVLGIARSHCGTVTVENVPPSGAIFRVFLPISS